MSEITKNYFTSSEEPEDGENREKIRAFLNLDLETITLYWLAISYKFLSLTELLDYLFDYWNDISDVENTLHELETKKLLEKSQKGWQLKEESFRENLLNQLAKQISQEIESGLPNWLDIFPLLQASTYEYIKQQQIKKIIDPIISLLEEILDREQIKQQIEKIIQIYRQVPYQESFAIGNLINLLVYLNNYLIEEQDFSDMSVWEADFTKVKLHNVNFHRSNLSGSSFLRSHLGMVLSVDVSPDGQYIATGDAEGFVKVFDVKTGAEISSLRRTNYWAWVWVVRFSPNGQIIASAGDDHQMTLWQFENSEKQVPLGICEEHNDAIRTIVWIDDNTLISGSGDHKIIVWNIFNQIEALTSNNQKKESQFNYKELQKAHTNSVRALGISQDKNYLISGGYDRKVILWKKSLDSSTSQWEKFQEYPSEFGKVRGVAFHPKENSTFISIFDEGVEIFKEFNRIKRLDFPKEFNEKNKLKVWILCLAIDPTGKWLATGDERGMIKIWRLDVILENPKLDKPEYEFKAHDNWIRSLAFIDEQRLVSGSVDCSFKTWKLSFSNSSTDIQSLRIIKSYRNWIWSLIYSPDGKYLISGHGDSKIRIWKHDNLDSPIQVLEGHSNLVRTMTITCDSKFLVTGGCDCLIKLWDIEQICLNRDTPNTESKNLIGHQSWVRCVRSHPTIPHIIASCGDDTTIRFWDIRTQKEYQVLGDSHSTKDLQNPDNAQRHTDPIRTIAFSSDGEYLASGGGDKKIIVWKLIKNENPEFPKYEYFKHFKFTEKNSGNPEWVWSLVFIDSLIFAAGGGNKEVSVFDVKSNEPDEKNPDPKSNKDGKNLEHESPLRILKYHAKTKCLASGGTDKCIKFERERKKYSANSEHEGTIRGMAFSPDGKTLATGGQDEHLYLWNVEDGTLLSKKRLVDPPYRNVKLDLVSGISDFSSICT